jgi:hypothetical protein
MARKFYKQKNNWISMKISIYWPTRKRAHSLMVSLSSYIMNATNNEQIEYIVIIDDDDTESAKALNEAKIIFKASHNVNIKIFTVERLGYAKLHHYHNLAAMHFTGDCLLERNDDHFCLTRGWDDKVRESIYPYKDEPIVIHQKGKNEGVWWATAPGINRKWYEVSTNNGEIGAFADVGIDVWLLRYAEQSGMKVIKAGYDMMSMQRGAEHAGKIAGDQLPDDDVLNDRRVAQKISEPDVRERLIQNLKNWKDEN